MLHLELICIGKTSFGYIQEGLDDYINRLKHFCKFQLKVLPDIKENLSRSELIKKEEQLIVKHLVNNNDYIVILDERGQQFTSLKFANWLDKKQVQGIKKIVVIIGGAYGFSEEFKTHVNEKISLSEMTFSHQIIRLIFTEQLYRAFSIIDKLPYHHE